MSNATEVIIGRLLEVIKPADKQGPEAAAKAALKVLKAVCAEEGMKPNIECFLVEPGHWGQSGWGACWESGPHEWGIVASMALSMRGVRLVETHYGFDVLFYKGE